MKSLDSRALYFEINDFYVQENFPLSVTVTIWLSTNLVAPFIQTL